MSAHLAKIGCLIGRHRWMYLISITGDEVIRVCGRCYLSVLGDHRVH